MSAGDRDVFGTETWRRALERYSAATHLTVVLVGPDGQRLHDPFGPTPMFDLLAGSGHDPDLVTACARRCLGREDGPGPPEIEEHYGLTAVGTPLTLAGETLGAAVGAYVLTAFPDQHLTQRLAAASGVPIGDLWAMLRRQMPLARERVLVYGELLQTICGALLGEQRRAWQLEEASGRLEEESQAKDRFLAVLSHELRTPLTAMLGWTRMLRSGRLDTPSTARAVEVIERNAKLQADLIEDLLYVSRIITGKIVLDSRPQELAPMIDVVVDTLRPAAQAKGIRLESVLDLTPVLVLADAVRIGQVVTNLLSNAIKFTPAGGHIEVRLNLHEREVLMTVTDTGTGITPDALPLVFERFRQADSAITRSYTGLGLGLAIARHLVELHGGTIEAASPGAGQGSTFTMRLPVLDVTAPGALTAFARMAGPPPRIDDVPGLAGLRVLVVDDDPDTRELLTTMLESHKIEVTTVASVSDAMKAFARQPPHILISDIGLPGESGYDLIRKVRELPRHAGGDVPALALTAYAHPEDARIAIDAGFHVHVAKPVEAVALALAIARLAGRQ